MLNLLQHYQKYYKSCPHDNRATSPTQLCQQRARLNPKYRQYTNCIKAPLGQAGVPSRTSSAPKKFVQKQLSNELSIGVM